MIEVRPRSRWNGGLRTPRRAYLPHGVDTEVLRSGASLSEMGQLLRRESRGTSWSFARSTSTRWEHSACPGWEVCNGQAARRALQVAEHVSSA